MDKGLSVITITKNEAENLEACLKSVKFADEIIIVDACSSDNTLKVAKKFTKRVFNYRGNSLGLQKRYGLSKASKRWILILDADEQVSQLLAQDIKNKILEAKQVAYDAFSIKYQNHFLGRPINYGGENYRKVRLFKKEKGSVSQDMLHEEVIINGKVGKLNGKILHHSYKSIPQIINKFRRYAKIGAHIKFKKQEGVSLKKLIFYPLHLFYARFLKEKGYKDGMAGLTLSALFAYMEFLIYLYLLSFRLTSSFPASSEKGKEI